MLRRPACYFRMLRWIAIALFAVAVACSSVDIASIALDRAAWVQGGREESGWPVYFHVAGDDIEYRVSPDRAYRKTLAAGEIPKDEIHGLEPVSIDVRYTNWFGLRRNTQLVFDVKKGVSGQVKAYLHEGEPWARVESQGDGGALVRFSIVSNEVTTVRYSVGDDSLNRTLERNEEAISLDRVPEVVAVRIDFVDGTSSEIEHERLGAER
jgi:hypothetical protein